ncbi:efflux RND transporter periplasmic adaptor subunit [Vibrio sp. WXL103]|uniref:efflux RND transporter periplasmic adaptor subunit n=1 Tax=Vibrio sp. WXL103 TaxID=3450710 RepID=UPI003EC81C2B
MRHKITQHHFKQSKLTVLIIGLALIGCNSDTGTESIQLNSDQPKPVKLIELGDTGFDNVQHFPARISANREVALSFQVPGLLESFAIKPGDYVTQGQLLATIDERDYINQRAMREADHQLAQVQFERISSLFSKKLISRAEYDSAAAQLTATQAALQLAQDQVKDTQIVAPFSGQVATTMVENHQYIQPQQTILLLQDTDELNVVIQLPASTLSQLQKHQINPEYQPTLLLDGTKGSRSFPITYKQHATQASPGTQSYEVVFSLTTPKDITLYSGMGATVSIDFNQAMSNSSSTQYYPVPLNAVLSDDASGLNQVWVYAPNTGTIAAQSVTIGDIVGDSILIAGDLQPGDKIAAAGLTGLSDGMQVKPLLRERGL